MKSHPTTPVRTKVMPTLDLRQFRAKLQEFSQGGPYRKLKDYVQQEVAPQLRKGIIQVSNHDIPTEVKESAYTDMRTFFALPEEHKAQYVDDMTLGEVTHADFLNMSEENRRLHMEKIAAVRKTRPFESGYVPYGTLRKEDWKDMWQTLPEHPVLIYNEQTGDRSLRQMDTSWPDELIPTFGSNCRRLYTRMHDVCRDGLRVVAIDLGLDPDFFVQHGEKSPDLMRTLHYKPYKDAPAQSKLTFASAHRDRSAMTCIFPESGLQQQDHESGEWYNLSADAGNVVLFTGIVPDIVSNGLYPAKIHRVPAPEEGQLGYDCPRMTVPFFKSVNQDFMLSPTDSAIRKRDGKVYYPLRMSFGRASSELGSQILKAQEYAVNTLNIQHITSDPETIRKAVEAVYNPVLRS